MNSKQTENKNIRSKKKKKNLKDDNFMSWKIKKKKQ